MMKTFLGLVWDGMKWFGDEYGMMLVGSVELLELLIVEAQMRAELRIL